MSIINRKQIPDTPSKIAIVGECWGRNEEIEGRPFVGASGKLLTYLTRQAGLSREQCYITNVVNKKPQDNKFYMFSKEEITKGVDELKDDLEKWQLDGLNIVAALGGNALEQLTGLTGIMKYRGSILESTLVKGLKVIPTIHPAMLIRGQTGCNPIVVADLRKVKKESEFPERKIPVREIQVVKDPTTAIALLESVTDIEKPVACDIETPIKQGKKRLLSYGVATSTSKAFVLTEPILKIPRVLRALGVFSKSKTRKIFHNANFDAFVLAHSYKIVTKNIEDTMIAQHICYPFLPALLKPKSLAFCGSMYTNEPYWKDTMGRELYIYNGKDCCITYEVYNALQKEMDSWGVREVYEKDRELIEPLLTMELKGIPVSMETLKRIKEKNELIIEKLEIIKKETIGDVNVQSPKQMNTLLYNLWRFPPVVKDGKITTDVKAMNKLESIPTPYQPLIGLIKKLRKHYTMRGFYNLTLDEDNRMRADFKIAGTLSGRLASSEMEGTGIGRNLQNIPKPLREIYIPDEGKIFINVDLSQAEARVVAALCGDKEWVEEFEREDTYIRIASFLFNVKKEDVTDDQRQDAKTITHACNYGESWKGLSETLKVTAQRAKFLMAKLYEIRPFLEKWHDEVARQVKVDRILRSSYGRIIQFFGLVSQKDIRTALSFNPQGIVADYLNRGIISIYNNIDEAELLLQVHDSILFQVDNNYEVVKSVIERVRELMKQTLTVNNFSFVIPCDFEIGYNWYHLSKVKGDFDLIWREVNERTVKTRKDLSN
ncbi:MAG: hypothetical protein KAU20_05830 [Nanoarchaeota archaeon]|nr:hypothetical protein [Nanoarchaeota archaeon]